jgi:hypothetical protein
MVYRRETRRTTTQVSQSDQLLLGSDCEVREIETITNNINSGTRHGCVCDTAHWRTSWLWRQVGFGKMSAIKVNQINWDLQESFIELLKQHTPKEILEQKLWPTKENFSDHKDCFINTEKI